MTVREILDAIHALPRPDRLRLVEQLNDEAMSDRLSAVEPQPPPGSMLDLVDGFYVYTGALSGPAVDHRVEREVHIDHLIARSMLVALDTSAIVAVLPCEMELEG